jgi:hypothetical protein
MPVDLFVQGLLSQFSLARFQRRLHRRALSFESAPPFQLNSCGQPLKRRWHPFGSVEVISEALTQHPGGLSMQVKNWLVSLLVICAFIVGDIGSGARAGAQAEQALRIDIPVKL